MSSTRAPESLDAAERILDAATNLFARHGFHAVTTRAIAAAVGLNVATVHYHVGTKRDLYVQVVRRLYAQEHDLIGAAIASIGDARLADPVTLRDRLLALVDALVTLMRRHPERPRLYVQRWLEGDDELAPVEAELSIALHRPLHDLLAQAQDAGTVRADLDVDLFIRSVSWMLFGYGVAGPIDWQSWRGAPHQPAALDAFRAYLHDYVTRMLGLPPP